MSTTTTLDKATICKLLDRFIRQRPGLDFGKYGDRKSYAAECRSVGKDLRDARVLLSAVENSGITAEQLMDAFSAYSGRLSIIERQEPHAWALDYATGQYFATEYRCAVCAVCARALWVYHRTDESTGDGMRRKFRNMFGLSIQRRWFN